MKKLIGLALISMVLVLITLIAQAQSEERDPVGITPTLEDVEKANMKRPYSPYAGRHFPTQPSFYYARVLEIPTPRWVVYDAKRFGVKLADKVWKTLQERAYTSPIWYTP